MKFPSSHIFLLGIKIATKFLSLLPYKLDLIQSGRCTTFDFSLLPLSTSPSILSLYKFPVSFVGKTSQPISCRHAIVYRL
ncbi:unnamed protein product [Citrullus colocynthis]|uniref:Uncharacterized protein n=1 Tax=Citrullus colocynthis TaxID=252529 RepID=A0ABP0Y7C9_9ROSI